MVEVETKFSLWLPSG